MIAGVLAALVVAQAAPVPVLTLDQSIAEAQAKNYDLRAARARLQQANEASSKAWSAYLPQLVGSGNYTRNNVGVVVPFPTTFAVRDDAPNLTSAPGQNIAGTTTPMPGKETTFEAVASGVENVVIQKQDQFSAQVQLNQAILAPALVYAIKNASLSERIAGLNTENFRRQVLFSAAQAYYGAASLKQAVAVQERQLAISRDHERDARVRYDAGTTPKVALLRAEIDRARAEQDLKRAQNAFASAKVSLATILDHQGDFEVEIPPPLPLPDPSTLEQGALRDRPDVQAAVSNVEFAERARDSIYTGYFPALGGFAVYRWTNATGFTGTNATWALGFNLTWTFLDGGLREAQLRENQARVVEADETRRSAEVRAIDDVRRSRLDLDSALANKAKAAEQLDLARENQRLTEVNYRAGAATYLEVTDAQAALLTAELGLVGETLNGDLAALRLLYSAGAFNPK